MIERYIIHSYYNTLLFLYNYNAKTDVINLHIGHIVTLRFIDGTCVGSIRTKKKKKKTLARSGTNPMTQ